MKINPFVVPSATKLAERELEETKRLLLVEQARAEHSAKMVEFYQGVVVRLEKYLAPSINSDSFH